jgi:NADPH:quinone reductase-like Zn-dependent oxidoreductase
VKQGIYVGIGGGGPENGGVLGPMWAPVKMFFYSPLVSQQFGTFMAEITKQDLAVLARLMETGKLRSVIDRTYPLSETPAAIRYLEAGHARGKVIVAVGDKRG